MYLIIPLTFGFLTGLQNPQSSDDIARRVAAIKADPAAAERLMRQMADRMDDMERRLKALEGKNPPKSPPISPPEAPRVKVSGFIQSQYQRSDRNGGPQFDAFRIRRARLTINGTLDPRTTFRLSEEVAAGTNGEASALREAVVYYESSANAATSPMRWQAGQFPLFLGYEIERGDVDRELPERASYNLALFPGERSRGISTRVRLGRDATIHVGAVDPLTIDDPDQVAAAPGAGSRIAAIGALRARSKDAEVGVSAFGGSRVASPGKPEVARQFTYLDGRYSGFLNGRLELRGEAMFGRDRLGAAATDSPLSGFQLQASYRLSLQDRLTFRWEQFDPNMRRDGDALNGYGVAFRHTLTPDVWLTLSDEVFLDGSRATLAQQRVMQTVLRLQVRF